jgi:hypothetical protein
LIHLIFIKGYLSSWLHTILELGIDILGEVSQNILPYFFDLFAGILTCQFGVLAAPPFSGWGGSTVKENRTPVLRQRRENSPSNIDINFLHFYGTSNV